MKFAGTITLLIAFFLSVESENVTKERYYSVENHIQIILEKMIAMEEKIKQLESSETKTKRLLRQCEESKQREIVYLKEKIIHQERDMQKLAKILSVRSNQDGKFSDKSTPDKEFINSIVLHESSGIGHNAEKRHGYRFLEYPTGPVAFSTYLSQSLSGLGLNQTIQYGGVLTNEGNAYNPHTGVFTCPCSGLYLISFFTSIYGISGVWFRLVVDDNNVSDAVSTGFDPFGDDQGRNVATLRLTAGQSVWTEMQLKKDANLSSTADFRHVTFSGVRLAD